MRWTPVVVAIALGLSVLAVVLAVLHWRQRESNFTLDQNLVAVNEAEQRREEKGNLAKSPMPDGRYDFWKGEESLIDPTKNALDSALREFCLTFARSDKESRTHIRESISMEEFNTLIAFSKRAAVFAIREKDPQWVVNGLTALAMIEQERVDDRDVLWALSLLYHSAKRIRGNPDLLLRNAAAISEPNISKLMAGFVARSPKDKDLRASWGYDEVQTRNGIGFIGWDFQDYKPTYDLKRIALELADFITSDKYQPESVEVASELPSNWLESKDNHDLDRILKRVRGGATIDARLRPGEHSSHDSQILMMFLVEAEDVAAARTLRETCEKKRPKEYGMVGVAEGRLFCLVVARSYVSGVQSFETSESLSRLSGEIARILRKYVSPA